MGITTDTVSYAFGTDDQGRWVVEFGRAGIVMDYQAVLGDEMDVAFFVGGLLGRIRDAFPPGAEIHDYLEAMYEVRAPEDYSDNND